MDDLPDEPLLTSLPCLVEAMYLLRKFGGHAAQEALWGLVDENLLVIDSPPQSDHNRVRDLMAQYADLPIDFADAALIALAERRRLRTIFTLDSDFYIFRLAGNESFTVIPQRPGVAQ